MTRCIYATACEASWPNCPCEGGKGEIVVQGTGRVRYLVQVDRVGVIQIIRDPGNGKLSTLWRPGLRHNTESHSAFRRAHLASHMACGELPSKYDRPGDAEAQEGGT